MADQKLWLIRHAIAEDAAPGQGDADRALSALGRLKLREVARGMLRLRMIPSCIAASPLLRARQTAEVLAEELSPEAPVLTCDALGPGGTGAGVLAYLEARAPGADVALIGHMPDVERLLGLLCGGPGLQVDFRRAAVAEIAFQAQPAAGAGVLVQLLRPRVLRRLRR